MAIFHWIRLSVGLSFLVVAVGVTAMSLDEQAKSKNTALPMPSINSARSQGRFEDARSDKFTIIQPAEYEYSPSQNNGLFSQRQILVAQRKLGEVLADIIRDAAPH